MSDRRYRLEAKTSNQPTLRADGFSVLDVFVPDSKPVLLEPAECAHLYLPAGEGVAESVDGGRRTWSAAHVEFRPPGHGHLLHLSPGTRLLRICVESWRFEQLAALVPDADQEASIVTAVLRGIPGRILDAMRCPDALTPILVPALVLELVAQAALVCRTAAGPPPVVEQVRTIVRQNLAGSLDVGRIARELRVSRRSLARAFQSSSGESLLEYALRARTEEALHLIATTDLPLKEIAARVGFYDQAHMSRQIKRVTGRTPLEHRRETHDAH
jgi:AraC-like DNA-binding protein